MERKYTRQPLTLNSKLTFFLIFFIIYFNESIMFRELFSASTRVFLILLITLFIILLQYKETPHCRLVLNRKAAYLMLSLIGLILFSCLINGFNIIFDGYTIVVLLYSYSVCSFTSFDIFKHQYINAMVLLSISGVIIFLLYNFQPDLFFMFPDYQWRNGGTLLKNCFFCVVQITDQNKRNFGIFQEPGVFAVLLGYALFFSLFKEKIEIKKTGILIAALLTTLSTMGYICCIVLIIAFFTNNSFVLKKTKNKLLLITSILFCITAGYLFYNHNAFMFLTNKLGQIHISFNVNTNVSGSGYERWRSIIYGIQCFITHPIFGIGNIKWSTQFSNIIMTATPINWFSLYGFLYGILMNYYYLKNGVFFSNKNIKSVIANVFLVSFFFINVLSQNMTSDIILLFLLFYQAKFKNYVLL